MIVFDLNSNDAEALLHHGEELKRAQATRARDARLREALQELKEALVSRLMATPVDRKILRESVARNRVDLVARVCKGQTAADAFRLANPLRDLAISTERPPSMYFHDQRARTADWRCCVSRAQLILIREFSQRCHLASPPKIRAYQHSRAL